MAEELRAWGELSSELAAQLRGCTLCPRQCGVDRHAARGYCGAGAAVRVAKAFRHPWEEPCLSGERGSGTVFFTGCNLRCLYCQNYPISHQGVGKEISVARLSAIFLELEAQGAHNINLVTPTPYVPHIVQAIQAARREGLRIPIVYNTGGYERVETLRQLEGWVDVYLPDLKYCDARLSARWSGAPDYFTYATAAIQEMWRQVGEPVFDAHGMLRRGLMIRHLTLPGALEDSQRVVDWVLDNLPRGVYLNLMAQYTPLGRAPEYPELATRVPREQYEALVAYALERGLECGFIQEMDSASPEYVPAFDLEGV
ncbi:MAG: radical SAM protein [Ardenticatenia bacterium]|jgi:putative pyruvate formate lyase activating enzyme|nr:MAG: radical SAM protein [Ardenticatenia bacterium]